MAIDLRRIRFGNLIRTSKIDEGVFDLTPAPAGFKLENVLRAVEGPYKAFRNGTFIEVALLQYQVNKVIIADVWVDLATLSTEEHVQSEKNKGQPLRA